jgi:squalene synthase HpnC
VSAVVESVEEWSGKQRGDENFPVGSLLISARLRKHVHAFYDFARNADDIADSPELAAEDKIARLDVMQAVLLGRRTAGSPSATRLRASLADCKVTARHACDLLVAFRRDATTSRYGDWDELAEYCRYSAMPVGRHVLDLHGESQQGWEASDALCTSLQILNHVQDCKADLANLDRCYLPGDMLRRFGSDVAEVRADATTPGLRLVFDTLLGECDRLNHIAANLPRHVGDWRLRLEVGVIVGLARRLSGRLRRGDPLASRVKLSRRDGVASVLASLRFLL